MSRAEFELFIAAAVGGSLAGFFCGAIPFVLGMWMRRFLVGIAALVVCTICGTLFGLILAAPVAVVFAIACLALGRNVPLVRPLLRGRDEEPVELETFLEPSDRTAVGSDKRSRARNLGLPAGTMRPVRDDVESRGEPNVIAPSARGFRLSPPTIVAVSLLVFVGLLAWGGLQAFQRLQPTMERWELARAEKQSNDALQRFRQESAREAAIRAEKAAAEYLAQEPERRARAEEQRRFEKELQKQQSEAARRFEEERKEEEARLMQARRDKWDRQDKQRREEADRIAALHRAYAAALAAEAERRAGKERHARLGRLAKPPSPVAIPQSVAGTGRYSAVRNRDEGLTWTVVPFQGGALAPSGPIQLAVSGMPVGACWAPDGQSFFVLSRNGRLCRVGYPDLEEIRRVDFGQECVEIGLSRLGLVILVQGVQELWLVDPETFAVVRRIGVAGVTLASTGPALGVAYVGGDKTYQMHIDEYLPVRVDLETGVLALLSLKQESGRPGTEPRFFNERPTVSSDGRWLFLTNFGPLSRLRIEDTTVIAEQSTPGPLASGTSRGMCLGPDGEWICVPRGIGGQGGRPVTAVYRSGDLSAPAFSLRQQDNPEFVGFDPIGKRVLCQNATLPLLVYDQNGERRGAYALGAERIPTVHQFAPHPTDGRGLLVVGATNIVLVEFDE